MKPKHYSALVIALICIPIFIGALDLTVVSAVLPHVIYDLEIPMQTGWDDAAWMVSGYLLAYTVAMTFMGRLSDLLGRRKIYLLALVVFALGSYLVAVADGFPTQLGLRLYYRLGGGRVDVSMFSLYILIGARMVQAFGAGAMVPVGMALAGDLYPPLQRARPLGVIAAVDTSGWVVGHLYGGIVARFFDWRLIFWLNLPVCLLAFVLIAVVLARLPKPEVQGRMDWLGALLISISLTMLNIGLGSGSEVSGIDLGAEQALPNYALPYLLAALVFLLIFLWQQSRSSHPLVPLRLFRQPNFLISNLANFLIGVSLFIAIANVPLFINTLVAQTLEQGAWDSGWMLSALTVPMALASIPGGWLTVRRGYRLPALLGLLLAVGGFALMSGWKADTPYLVMIPQLMLTGVGLGFTMAPVATAVVNAAIEGYRGIASSMVIIFRLVGMTVGVSSLATYGLHRANYLSALWMGSTNDLAEVARVAMLVGEKVVSETFLIAGAVCVLALIPVIFFQINPGQNKGVANE